MIYDSADDFRKKEFEEKVASGIFSILRERKADFTF